MDALNYIFYSLSLCFNFEFYAIVSERIFLLHFPRIS